MIVLLPVAFIMKLTVLRSEPLPIAAAQSFTEPAATPSSTKPATAEPTASPALLDCTNENIKVSVTADAQTYVIGQLITIAMRIANVGDVACRRDVGALVNEVYVTNSDGLVVWTSDACQQAAKPQVAVMKVGSIFGSTQVWSGLNSGQNCTNAAADAQPGKYLVYGRNDTVVSAPFAIELTD